MGGSWEQEKWWFPLPFLLSCELLASVKENSDRKRKKKEETKKKKNEQTKKKKKKKKNTDWTQTKLNAPQVRFNVKILPH